MSPLAFILTAFAGITVGVVVGGILASASAADECCLCHGTGNWVAVDAVTGIPAQRWCICPAGRRYAVNAGDLALLDTMRLRGQ